MSLFIPPRLAPAKASPQGPGAGILLSEFPLSTITGQQSPQAKMLRYWNMANTVPWIVAAERAISDQIGVAAWHLEDQDDDEIDDEYPNAHAQVARALLEKPYGTLPEGMQITRRELWQMTSNVTGICGSGFWYLDAPNPYGMPLATKFLAPWRMFPVLDEQGNLVRWALDRTQNSPGTPIEVEQVIHFKFRPSPTSQFGIGLMDSAVQKAQNTIGLDHHLAQVLDAGGRLSGFLSPKGDNTINDQNYNQLVQDSRSIVEMPDTAKRLQIVRGPVEFTQTTMTLADLQLVDTMSKTRDDILALWGVPLSQVGGTTAAGLNSGETRKYDEAALWQNAIHPRLVAFTEAIQFQLLDRWTGLGVTVELEIDEPEFDDDSPRFDLLGKSLAAPLRNRERRALVGLDPFGPEIINPATGIPLDDEVWLPTTQAQAFLAPEDAKALANMIPQEATPVPPEPTPSGPPQPSPVTVPPPPVAKASLHDTLKALRAKIDAERTPGLRSSVAQVLHEQRSEITQRAKAAAEHLMRRPSDTTPWWDGPRWDQQMMRALKPQLVGVAASVDTEIRIGLRRHTKKAGPAGAVTHALTRGATRVTALNARTRDAVVGTIRTTVAAGIAGGKSPAEVGDDLEAALDSVTLDNGLLAFDEYRAELIARTELMASYNDATLGSYGDADIEQVEAIDGDDDPECAERNGQVYSLEEANDIEDHPNGTLDWLPVLAEVAA